MNTRNEHERYAQRARMHAGAHLARSSGVVSRIRIAIAEARARIGASAWTAVVVRVGSLAIALVILAWIGRTVTAAHASVLHLDADAGSASTAGAALSASTPLVPPPGAAPPSVTAASSTTSVSRTRATESDPVFVNHASADELRRLPGVGAKRAEAIITLRQRVGRFQRIEDLLRVKGIGRATLRKWRTLVRLDAPAGTHGGGGADAGRP